MVHGIEIARGVGMLHHRDVECLVTNYLHVAGLCTCVWTGCRTFESVDHVGLTRSGDIALAQTTVPKGLVAQKSKALYDANPSHDNLWFFGPREALSQCHPKVIYYAIEDVFSALDEDGIGRTIIDRMAGIDL